MSANIGSFCGTCKQPWEDCICPSPKNMLTTAQERIRYLEEISERAGHDMLQLQSALTKCQSEVKSWKELFESMQDKKNELEALADKLVEAGKMKQHRSDEAHTCWSLRDMPEHAFYTGKGYVGSNFCDCDADTHNLHLQKIREGK